MENDRKVIILGSGPTGATAAYVLVSKGIPVTMLESGNEIPNGLIVRFNGRNLIHRGATVGLRNVDPYIVTGDPQTKWYTNHSLGGLSNLWTGATPRFSPEDFYEGERLDERYRWPVRYEELVPYFELAERLLVVTAGRAGVPGLPAGKPAYFVDLPADWQTLADCAYQRGQGLAPLPLANGRRSMIASQGTTFNSYSNILYALLRSPHFRLFTGAYATRLEWSGGQKKLAAVHYHNRAEGSTHRLPAAAVVAACGALNTTKLLLNSACGDFPDGLGNTEGVLGHYLHDHPREWYSIQLEKPLSRLSHAAYITRLPPGASRPLLASSCTIGHASMREKLAGLAEKKGHSFGLQVFGTMVPKEEHYVRLNPQQIDEAGQPGLEIHIRFDQETLQNMAAARENILSLFREAGYSPTIPAYDEHFYPGSSVHYGGTVRMHQSPQYGMLDGWNRLHAVPNAVVVDASCFTTGPEKNPTLTAMAIAARAAGRLAEDLKTGSV